MPGGLLDANEYHVLQHLPLQFASTGSHCEVSDCCHRHAVALTRQLAYMCNAIPFKSYAIALLTSADVEHAALLCCDHQPIEAGSASSLSLWFFQATDDCMGR